jgi:simple sugar transport system permease protein
MPLIRIAKRDNLSRKYKVLLYIAAILFALLVGSLLLLALGADPVEFFGDLLTIGLVKSRFPYKNIESYIKIFVPLLITSLALSMAFKMKFWNIGGEGQFITGAIVAAWVGIISEGNMSSGATVFIMALCGGVAAGIYGMLTAILRVKFGTNETLMTLMLNYIALYVLKFFGETKGDWNIFLRSDSTRPVFRVIPENAWMPAIQMGKFRLNISLIIALLLAVFIAFYLKKTKHGYEISVVGDSISTAKYAGMKVGKIIVRTIFFSAFLIGVAGAFHVSTSTSLSISITNDVGWTGIIVAWLAKLEPLGIFITSVLIGILQYGCQVASTNFTRLDTNFANLLQSIILFSVLAVDFFIRFKVVINKKPKKEEETK